MSIQILDTYSAPFRGRPKAPKYDFADPANFVANPLFDKRLQGVEKQYVSNLMKYLEREPGFTAQEIDAMYEEPAEQTKAGERSSLRRLNQGAAFGGGYGSGARTAGRGAILAEGTRTRASLRRQTLLDAAKAALADRLNQLAAAGGYTGARAGLQMNQTALNFAQQADYNRFQQGNYQSELDQFNKEYDEGMAFWSSVLNMATGGMGGGGGMMGGAAGMGMKGICWVARAIYGEHDDRWLLVRRWMLERAPAKLLELYVRHGQELAARIRREPAIGDEIRPFFDWIVETGG